MKIYTLNVGQGQFVVVTGDTQAIIIDTHFIYDPKYPIIHIKSALSNILEGKHLVGLMITGFDQDHFNEDGLKIVLHKYRPDWIMYPKYFKETGNANRCFDVINSFDNTKEKFKRHPILLGKNNLRLYSSLSNDFSFEIFSPHVEDMDSSNNCSLVCKIKEKSTNVTYLVTGDTENKRWDSIVKAFGNSLKSDVLDAPHHGSKNGITVDAMDIISPHTVLISAGFDSKYGHPDSEAVDIFIKFAEEIYSTNCDENGQSLVTTISKNKIKTERFFC